MGAHLASGASVLCCIVAAWLTAGGCVPLPFASPPLHLTLEGGVAGGRMPLPSREASRRRAAQARGQSDLLVARVGVHPLQFLDEPERWLDVGLGYVHERLLSRPFRGPSLNGGYLVVGGIPWSGPMWPSWSARLSLQVGGDLLMTDDPPSSAARALTWGLTASAILELVNFSDGPLPEPAGESAALVGGYCYGETAFGIVLSGGYRQAGQANHGFFTAGVSLRLPASFGLYIVTL